MDAQQQTPLDETEPEKIEFLTIEDEEAALGDLREAALQRMLAGGTDPRRATYIMRLDRRTIVRTDAEHDYCVASKIKLAYVPYGKALSMVNQQASVERAIAKRRVRNKNARKQRKAARR